MLTMRKLCRIYEKNAVSVCGLVGTGKDMLTANVIERRKKPHVSNAYYNELTMPYRYDLIDCGGNTYKNFISGDVLQYDFPYFDGCDIYLSDCGIYFPSQFCNELNREYKNLPTFMALTRHLGKCHVHYNAQALNRVWDKIREMSDVYLRCRWCRVINLGKLQIVVQLITSYDKYESCVNDVKPCKVHVPFGCKAEAKAQRVTYVDNFRNTHGSVKNHLLIYRNKSIYDTRFFKKLLKEGRYEKKA